MALKFHPKMGTILICDYTTGFRPPEMVKSRPVVVISPRLRKRNNLCTVVPLSTTRPETVMPYHFHLKLEKALPEPWGSNEMWVKADMLSTVSFDRLNLIRLKRKKFGERQYVQPKISKQDIDFVQQSVLAALGIKSLTQS